MATGAPRFVIVMGSSCITRSTSSEKRFSASLNPTCAIPLTAYRKDDGLQPNVPLSFPCN